MLIWFKPRFGKKSMDINSAEEYFKGRARELRNIADDGTAWVFVGAAALIDYLAKLVDGKDNKAKGYKKFIRTYMKRVRPQYRTFKYKNGKQDLDVQMYHILRCGIVHSFSFVPDNIAKNQGGRERSIALCHRKSGLTHLSKYSGGKFTDAAVFVAEDFVEDLSQVIEYIFSKAKTNKSLTRRIKRWLKKHPPIQG